MGRLAPDIHVFVLCLDYKVCKLLCDVTLIITSRIFSLNFLFLFFPFLVSAKTDCQTEAVQLQRVANILSD